MQWSCHKHIPITIMLILEWNLHDMNEMLLLMIPVPSPHRLLSTCNMPCMKNVSQSKRFFLVLQFKIIGHTPTNCFIYSYWTFSNKLLYSKVLGNLNYSCDLLGLYPYTKNNINTKHNADFFPCTHTHFMRCTCA